MLFIENKYTKLYFKIIENAQSNARVGYVESHHIIPKSAGGVDNPSNRVNLTAREHYICHILLTKMTTGKLYYKMLCAVTMMGVTSGNQQRYKPSSRVYESAKKRKNQLHGELFTGGNNPFYGKHHSEETKELLRKKRAEQVARQGNTMPLAAREKLRAKATCPHCGLVGGASIMKMHHFDHCKTLLATSEPPDYS